MAVDAVIKLIKAMKPNQCYLLGGTLIAAGLTGSSYPFWYPLADDVIRSSLNLASETESYSASTTSLFLSGLTMILGVALILFNRYLEHQERVQSREVDNVVPLRSEPQPAAFEADSGGEIIVNRGRLKNYDRVAKASNRGVVELNDTDAES